MTQALFEQFEKSTLTVGATSKRIAPIPWNAHKDFSGVSLKHIVTDDLTAGRFTCHLVRIEPDCRIGLHTHPASIELHEVISGSGVCVTPHGEIVYTPGSIAVLACDMPHEVRAGAEGLCLFAKFIAAPA